MHVMRICTGASGRFMKKIFLALIVLTAYFTFSGSDQVDLHASDVDASCSVVMFTTDWCGTCKTAKTYFKKQNYSYCEFDVEKDPLANLYYQELDTGGVPTILIGNRMTLGFYPDKIDELMSGLD